ncbi:MAG TPA: sulfite oxidase-like oxidoreductase [Isosphaeraceae bacterium]|jgi:DMSO/TMAO reductase YedYZ molybdopterin-dependent catalytic subunit|nr:sulfite oxidase-like oxidoreductase [Isosphaeraceae bacterium]
MSDRPTDPTRKVSPLELARIALRGAASYLAAPKQAEPTAGAEAAAADVVSADTRREQRLPPGQVKAKKWPVLHAGRTPKVDLERWAFRASGLVERPRSWSWAEFRSLPAVAVYADMHCVTRWSLLDNVWEGVSVREVLRLVEPKPEARFVLVLAEEGYTTNLPLADFAGEDCLFAWSHNGQPLTPNHGGPLRLVVPRLYAWKSAKWIRGIELLAEDRPGFWERNGYHDHGDPWAEKRFS